MRSSCGGEKKKLEILSCEDKWGLCWSGSPLFQKENNRKRTPYKDGALKSVRIS